MNGGIDDEQPFESTLQERESAAQKERQPRGEENKTSSKAAYSRSFAHNISVGDRPSESIEVTS